ncbi:hypothetical protein Moror_6486 [Moniliophthora roreri MCA 2997]|uniref:DUF6593 domain-containing protein n=1 Tax=Moniliophthora roreri (strain MCA 2997) TaxID=1381753 RepID=V2XCJ0_MONRO|nr:hypothetical protein Moror_6486 [Moniliophthora roreri MCA 2997]
MDNDPTYDLFFIGAKEDPRSCSIIGEDDTKPIYFSFETYERPMANKRTIISRGRDAIASFEWGPGNHLGYVYVGQRSFPMSHLMLPGSSSNARSFSSTDGRRFEWRRVQGSPSSYDLYMLPNHHIAAFRRYVSSTAVGPSHGLLQYKFMDDMLLLECLLSLCVQRYMDSHGI